MILGLELRGIQIPHVSLPFIVLEGPPYVAIREPVFRVCSEENRGRYPLVDISTTSRLTLAQVNELRARPNVPCTCTM